MECAKLSLLILRPHSGFLIVIDVLRQLQVQNIDCVIIVSTVMILILHLQILVAFLMMRWIMASDANVNVELKLISD